MNLQHLSTLAVGLILLSSKARADETPPATTTAPEPPASNAPLGRSPSYHLHDGFFFRGAIGYAYLSDSTHAQTSTASADVRLSGSGVAAEFSFGHSVMPGLILGGILGIIDVSEPKFDYAGRTGSVPSSELQALQLGIVGEYYPDPTAGFHVGALVALADATLKLKDEEDQGKGLGFALGAQAGYEWWAGPDWSLGFMGRLLYSNNDKEYPAEKDTHSILSPQLLFAVTYN